MYSAIMRLLVLAAIILLLQEAQTQEKPTNTKIDGEYRVNVLSKSEKKKPHDS